MKTCLNGESYLAPAVAFSLPHFGQSIVAKLDIINGGNAVKVGNLKSHAKVCQQLNSEKCFIVITKWDYLSRLTLDEGSNLTYCERLRFNHLNRVDRRSCRRVRAQPFKKFKIRRSSRLLNIENFKFRNLKY